MTTYTGMQESELVVLQEHEECLQEERASPEEFYVIRKSRVWTGAFLVTGLVVTVGVSIGVFTRAFSNSPALATSKSLEATNFVSASQPSTWVATAPAGPMHPRASPRSLSAAEYLQSPKLSEKVADQITKLHQEFTGRRGELYSDPEEKLQAHTAAAHAIGSFIGNLSKSHPQVAILLHDIRLNDAQQHVAYKVLDHYTDKSTMKLGAEVIDATIHGLVEGKNGIKKRLQEKLGPHLDELRRIRNEIFPKNFDGEEKKNVELRGSEDHTDDDAHLQMLQQGAGGEDLTSITALKNHFNHNEGSEASGRRLVGFHGWGIVNLLGTIISTLLVSLLSVVVPGRTGVILIMGIKDALTIVTCAEWRLAPLNWVGCVINLINAVLVTIFTFVPPIYSWR